MFGVSSSDRRVVNSNSPSDRRVSTTNIKLIDMLGRRVDLYKKRLSKKQDAINRTIRDEKKRAKYDRQQKIELRAKIKALVEKSNDQDAVIKEQETKIKNLANEINYLSNNEKKIEEANLPKKLSTCLTSVQELNTAKLPEQQNVKLKKPKVNSIKRNQSKSASITNKRTCSVPILSKKAKSQNIQNKTYDTNKMHELSLLTVDEPYLTVLGDYNPEKDDSILVKKTSNLELPSLRDKNITSCYLMEGTEDMTDDIYKNRHDKLEANERHQKRWDMQQTRELRQNEYLKENNSKLQNKTSNEEEQKNDNCKSEVNEEGTKTTNSKTMSLKRNDVSKAGRQIIKPNRLNL